jgi:hypothetical protein
MEIIDVYITKYALTKGIMKKRAERKDKLIHIIGSNYSEYYYGNEWHFTLESAKLRAIEMRDKKIKSCQDTIANLEKLSF